MSSEFYSRLKFHKRLGIFMLAVMQTFFSCLFLRLDIFSTKGAALAIGMAVYMVLIVVLKLYDLYGRPIQDMIKTEALLAGGIGLVAVIILCILEGAGVILPVIAECILTIAIYVLWIRLMKLWFKREFGPHQYVTKGTWHLVVSLTKIPVS